MRRIVLVGLLLAALLAGRIAVGDVTDTTPYDYGHPPKPDKDAEGSIGVLGGPYIAYACPGGGGEQRGDRERRRLQDIEVR